MRVTVVLLAAGGSRRLGEAKQLLQLAGQSLVRRAALAALGSRAERVLVVTGSRANEVEAALAGLAVECVRCAGWEAGLAASLRTGIEAALAPRDTSVLVQLADQPAVDATLLDALIAKHAAGAEIAACEYSGGPGVPALFSPHFTRELLALEGDRGAKALLVRERAHVARVPFADGALDVDTRDDWERARRILEARAAGSR